MDRGIVIARPVKTSTCLQLCSPGALSGVSPHTMSPLAPVPLDCALNRFDLLWLVLDHKNTKKDKDLARFVASLYCTGAPPTKDQPDVDESFFKCG